MKKSENKVRWDPLTARLAESSMKQNVYVPETKQLTTPTKQANKPKSTEKRRSKEDFEEYIKSLFADDKLPFKYQNPDAWIPYQHRKKKKVWDF